MSSFFPNRIPKGIHHREAQSSGAFDRATRLSSSKSHAEVRNQIVLVVVLVLVLEGGGINGIGFGASPWFRLLRRPPVFAEGCGSCDISSLGDR
jgi:hypothetical protein